MFEKDDEAARKARAETLMAEIDRLTSQQSQPEKDKRDKDDQATGQDEAENQPSESPRDFIHRRMRELDKQKDRED